MCFKCQVDSRPENLCQSYWLREIVVGGSILCLWCLALTQESLNHKEQVGQHSINLIWQCWIYECTELLNSLLHTYSPGHFFQHNPHCVSLSFGPIVTSGGKFNTSWQQCHSLISAQRGVRWKENSKEVLRKKQEFTGRSPKSKRGHCYLLFSINPLRTQMFISIFVYVIMRRPKRL